MLFIPLFIFLSGAFELVTLSTMSFCCLCLAKGLHLRITLYLYFRIMFSSLIVFAVYFSEKEGDEGSSKDILLTSMITLIVILVVTIAVLVVIICMCRKGKCPSREEGNFIIEVQYVIYCGFISFSGHDN